MQTIVSFVGLPGSGKSTLASAIATRLQLPILSTGKQLRLLSATDSGLEDTLATGQLGPESVVQAMVDTFLDEHPVAVLDGYPRHPEQARHLLERSAHLVVVRLIVPREVAVSRIAQRPKRGDDTPDSIRTRIEREQRSITDMLECLPNVFEVDATQPLETTISAISERILTTPSRG